MKRTLPARLDTHTRRYRPGHCAIALIAAGTLTLGLLPGCSLVKGNEGGPTDPSPYVEEPTGLNDYDAPKPADGTDCVVVEDGLTGYAEGEAMGYESYAYTDCVSEPYPDDYPDDFNTEEYNAVDEPGFTSTTTRPLSTLSADVDTASYCNLRRMIEEGYGLSDIPTGAVRTEEMLNYFSYDYGSPEGDDLFAMTASVGPCPWNPDTELLVLGFATAPEDTQIADAGCNLVFLIDVSGSMDDPDKLPLLQDTFGVLVDNLGENDRISIVTYASGEEVVLNGASGSDRREIMHAINSLEADGSTNGEAGLEMAYQVAEENYLEGGVNRIILASDGDLNVGMTSESELKDYVEDKRDEGIYLSVLGFGSGNYKDNKMETLADNGNGSYHYIDCAEEAERVFDRNLTANLVPLADDVKIQVEFNPAEIKAYRLIGYENRAMADEDFTDDTKDAGEVGPGMQFTVAYEIVRVDSDFEIDETDLRYDEVAASTSAATDGEWLVCSLRYTPADGGKAQQQELIVTEDDWAKHPGDDWEFQASVIEFSMICRDSEYVGDADMEMVLETLDALDEQGALDDDREGFYELVKMAY